MASLYPRHDSKELWIACYPKPGKLVRVSSGTEDRRLAERTLRKVELLLELERMQDVPVPQKIMSQLEGIPRSTPIEPIPENDDGVALLSALRAYVTGCTPSANSSIILRLNAGMSSGLRLVTIPLSTTTSSSTHSPPAFSTSVRIAGQDVVRWPPAWRYTTYDYPHYHSTTHEVIGIFRGEADVRFGDDAGFTARVSAGDVVVIPAGVSHQRLWQTDDFQGVGAYPEGYEVDEIRKDTNALPAEERNRIREIAIPPAPLMGTNGPLKEAWSQTVNT